MLPALGPACLMVQGRRQDLKTDGKEAWEVSARSSWSRPQGRAVFHDCRPKSLGQVKGWTHEIALWMPVTLLPSHPKACPVFSDQAGVSPGVVDVHIQQHCVSLEPGTKRRMVQILIRFSSDLSF